jgi:phage head maturation protease
VALTQTKTSLQFRARLSKTRAADEALELVNDGVLSDVSLMWFAYRSRQARDADGPWVERMEVRPVELSLAITGTGQYPGARVTAVRAASLTSQTPKRDALAQQLGLLRPY